MIYAVLGLGCNAFCRYFGSFDSKSSIKPDIWSLLNLSVSQRLAYMVKHSWTEFSLFTACSVKKTVIYYKHIFSIRWCQLADIVIDYICGNQGSETKPISFYRVHKTIKSIFWKVFGKSSCLLLHIHTLTYKDVAKLVSQKWDCRNTFFLCAVTFFQKFT